MKNRRAFPRFATRFAVCVITEKATVPVQPLEISEAGLSFVASDPFMVGQAIDVEFKLEGEVEWIRVKSSIRHVTDTRIGAEFLNLKRRDRLKILDLLAATVP